MTERPGGVTLAATDPSPAPVTARPLLLYDGLCGFCDRTVQFILRRDPDGPMRFAPLQGSTAADVLGRFPSLREVDSLVLVTDLDDQERVAVRSAAILGIARYLGGWYRLADGMRVFPRPLRDWGYTLFARHRYRWFGRYDACPIPTPDIRDRFLP